MNKEKRKIHATNVRGRIKKLVGLVGWRMKRKTKIGGQVEKVQR